jgi:hypothetical protein
MPQRIQAPLPCCRLTSRPYCSQVKLPVAREQQAVSFRSWQVEVRATAASAQEGPAGSVEGGMGAGGKAWDSTHAC